MAERTVYGLTNSENHWDMVDEGSCVWVAVPGTAVHLQIREGQPAAIMGAFAADFNAHIEDLNDNDSGCWTPTNSVASSNHLSATAMDLNWESHRFRISYDGFNQAQIDTCRELLDFYEETIFWGQDWDNPKDCMHWQMGYDTYGAENVDKVNAFIARKIRADGFSTFRRGSAPVPNAAANVLARATGLTLLAATQLLPTMQTGLSAADCTNPKRIAMFIAQTGEESAGFDTTEEYASGAEYEGRCSDLGNCDLGDGVKYKGRTYIQITGKGHYAQFSQWCFDRNLVPTATYFVDNPTALGDLRWAGIGAAWYWTVERPQINSLCDAGDLIGVTKAINGGLHGLADRQARYDRAIALGNQLLEILNSTPGDDMATVPQEQWDRVYRELTQLLPSRSPLRHLGEGDIDTMAGFVLNTDGSVHVEVVRLLAGYGHPPTLALLREVATADPVQWPDRQEDAKIAQAILNELGSAPTKVATKVGGNVIAPGAVLAPPPPLSAPAPQVVYVDRPVPAASAPAVSALATTRTAGQLIGEAYDALSALPADLSDADKASLTSLLGVLGRLAGITGTPKEVAK